MLKLLQKIIRLMCKLILYPFYGKEWDKPAPPPSKDMHELMELGRLVAMEENM